MSILIKKLDELGQLSFWDKNGIRWYPKGNFAIDCDKSMLEAGINADWWFDGQTGKIEFSYARKNDSKGENISYDDAKEVLKKVIRIYVSK